MTTAIYPLKRELEYTVLGLCSEAGELGLAYAEAKSSMWGFTSAAITDLLKEAGDCYWYVAAVADALNVDLQTIWESYAPQTLELKSRGFLVVYISGRSGEMAGVVKKAIRDNDGFMSEAGAEKIKVQLGLTLIHLNELVRMLGSTPEAVTAKNLNKLADRKKRGVLQGSGDNR